ncbi:MAG: hypothetical protein ACHQ4H_15705, partial [Ktedonobacterales bacterium]
MSLRGVLPLLIDRPEFARLRAELARDEGAPLLPGVADAAKPYVVAALAVALDRPVLYVVRDGEEMERATEALRGLAGNDIPVLAYADRDTLPYERLLPEGDAVKARMNALTALARPVGALLVVMPARALAQPVMPPQEYTGALVELRPGMQLDPRILMEHLLSLGYEHAAEVEDAGQISHRGGIVDVFPPALVRPVRIEFFGDEIESIRTFDPETQRSLNPLDAVLVGPAREALALRGPAAARMLAKLDQIGMDEDARARWRRDLEALANSQSFDDIGSYLPYLHAMVSPLAYLSRSSGLLVLYDAEALARTIQNLEAEGEEVRDRLERDGENPPGLLPALIPWEQLAAEIGHRPRVRFAPLVEDEGTATVEHAGSG